MVRGKTTPVRSLADNLHEKVTLFCKTTNNPLVVDSFTEEIKKCVESVNSLDRGPLYPSDGTPISNGSPHVGSDHRAVQKASRESVHHNTGSEHEVQLTALQRLISEAILEHKGAIHFQVLQEHVLTNWDGLRTKDGQSTDCKRAILASLSKNIRTQPLFKRASDTKWWWLLGEYNPLYSTQIDMMATQLPMIDEPLHDSVLQNSALSASLSAGKSRSKNRSKDNGVLTELQVLIIESIAECGGTATIEQITDGVSQQWGSLRRRDGSKYTADCRRAVQASLANNPSSRPIFRKESRKKGIWGLARRATEYLQQKGYSIEHFCTKSGTDHDTDAEGEGSSDDSPSPEDPEMDDQEEEEILSEQGSLPEDEEQDKSEDTKLMAKGKVPNESEDAADSDDGENKMGDPTPLKMKEEEIRVDTSCSLQSMEDDMSVLGKRNKPLLQVPPTKRVADP